MAIGPTATNDTAERETASAASTGRGRAPCREPIVTYPSGAVHGTSVVEYAAACTVRPGTALFTAETPFHPVDPTWPDQPADHGHISLGGAAYPVVDTLTAAFHRPTGDVLFDDEITARRGDADHVFLIAHLVEEDLLHREGLIGAEAELSVDPVRRRALSVAHTSCHLVAYAFNKSVDHLWRKEAPRNSLGHRDFDRAALLDSRHDTSGSVDRYRLGRSLHRRGFSHAEMMQRLPELVRAANDQLRAWLDADAPVRVLADSPHFTGLRRWVCELPDGVAEMPCGGTHVERLGEIESITISTEHDPEAGVLSLRAAAVPRPAAG